MLRRLGAEWVDARDVCMHSVLSLAASMLDVFSGTLVVHYMVQVLV